MSMEVKVLGTGCPKCKRLEQLAHDALTEAGIAATLSHVTNISEIMAYPITSTPGLVINDKVVCSGRLPRKGEIVAWLKEGQS